MIQEIKDIYKYQKEVPAPMLSDYEGEFWGEYVNNFEYFDRIFMKKYRSWFPMDQEGTLAEIAAEFAGDVESWLMINDKRYTELYRIQTITDNAKYSLTDNVYETETIQKSSTSSGSNVKGSETITDNATNQYGAQSDTETKALSYGQQSRTESMSKTFGTGEKTTVNSTSAFNESDYTPTDRQVETDQTKTDTENNTITFGAYNDGENNSYSHGAHTDTLSNSRVEGQRTDTSTGSGSENLQRTRSGNIGVKTVDQMLEEHKTMWIDFSFYEFIFAEIARELLRGVM